MILRVTDTTGDTAVDTVMDIDLARELFAKANLNGMWGKGTKAGQSEFIPNGVEFDNLDYDEVVMLPRQVGG